MLKNFEELEGRFEELKNDISEAEARVSQLKEMSGEYESGKCQERKKLDSDCSLEDKWCSLEEWAHSCARGMIYNIENQLGEILYVEDRIVSLTKYVVGETSFGFKQMRDNAIQIENQVEHIRIIIQENESFLKLVDEAIQSTMAICWDDQREEDSCWDDRSESELETLKTVWDAQDLNLNHAVSRLGGIISEMGDIMWRIDAVNTSFVYGVFKPISQTSEIQQLLSELENLGI